jgi:hypothetical protein
VAGEQEQPWEKKAEESSSVGVAHLSSGIIAVPADLRGPDGGEQAVTTAVARERPWEIRQRKVSE